MKIRHLVYLIALATLFFLPHNADAQFMTEDLILIKVGYVPISTVGFDEGVIIDDIESPTTKIGDLESKGFAVQGEYNLIFGSFWVGFGFEYQRLVVDSFSVGSTDAEEFANHFICPMLSAKFAAIGGLYLGAGLAGKYLISTEDFSYENGTDKMEFDKKIDLWANAILGYHIPVGEGIFLDIEGRFGYNLTNKQYEKMNSEDIAGAESKYEYTPSSAYDIAFFVGIGTRARGSMY